MPKESPDNPGLLWRLRALFLLFVVLGLFGIVHATGEDATENGSGALIAAAQIWMVVSACIVYFQRKPHALLDAADIVMLFLAGMNSSEFDGIASTVYPVTFFTSLYGSRQRVAVRAFLWTGAFVVSLALGGSKPDILIGQVPALLFISFVMHMLSTTLVRQHRSFVYEQVLSRAGEALVTASTRDEVQEAALGALHGLAAQSARTTASLLRIEGNDNVVVASRGYDAGALVGRRFPLSDLDRTSRVTRIAETPEGIADILAAPLQVNGAWVATLGLASMDPIPEDVEQALGTLGSQVSLALENITNAERYRSLVQRSSDVTAIVDTSGSISYLSPSFKRLTGLESSSTVGADLTELVHGEDVMDLLSCFAGHGVETQQIKLRWRHVDGRWRKTEVVITDAVSDPSVNGWVLNIRDVTDRDMFESELRRAQKLESVGKLAAGVAHEINTPIQFLGDNIDFLANAHGVLSEVISGYRDALVEDGRSMEERRAAIEELEERADADYFLDEMPEALEQASEGVHRVAEIVRAMRSFGQAERSDRTLLDVNDVIRNTAIVARSELSYVADLDLALGEVSPVHGFPGELDQVVLNLLVNAAHAIADVGKARADASSRGQISVETYLDGSDVVVKVTDTGTGIPVEAREQVFDLFFTTKPVGSGTGQGLSLARTIVVERHGGSIDFDTEMGVGTTFTVRLPI